MRVTLDLSMTVRDPDKERAALAMGLIDAEAQRFAAACAEVLEAHGMTDVQVELSA